MGCETCANFGRPSSASLEIGLSPSLLLFFDAWLQVDLESRLRNADFVACWREEDEIPFFLLFGNGVHSEVTPELRH